MEINTIINKNCLDGLKELPDESVDCCITSPPYYALRDYGVDGQIGLEETPELFIEKLVEIFDEVRRVLKKDGTIWVNMGDSYCGTGSKGDFVDPKYPNGRTGQAVSKTYKLEGLKSKDLIGIPWMLAFALRKSGWYLRQDIIWNKPNPMPESVTDRCTKAHEYIFLLSKSPKYYYDNEAIKTPLKLGTDQTKYAWSRAIDGSIADNRKGTGDQIRKSKTKYKERGNKTIVKRPKLPTQSEFVSFMRERITIKQILAATAVPASTVEHWFRSDEAGFSFPSKENWEALVPILGNRVKDSVFDDMHERMTYEEFETDAIGKNSIKGYHHRGEGDKKLTGHSGNYDKDGNLIGDGFANKKSVWTVTTKGFSGPHFATFPEKLIVDMVKAGCREEGIILDTFMGAGTTAVVARKLNRNFIGFELNKEYIAIANKRLSNELGMFL